MKNKKRLGFVSAIMGLCLSVSAMAGTVALADDTNDTPTYEAAQNLKDLVYFYNPIDYFTNDGKVVDKSKVKTIEAVSSTGAEGVYVEDSYAMLYTEAGDYTVTCTFTDSETPVTATVTVIDGEAVQAPKYTVDELIGDVGSETVRAAFETALETAISGLKSSDKSLTIPSNFWNMCELDVLESKHVVTKLYVAKPKSDFSVVNSSWKNTMSKITLSDAGEYHFYVEIKNHLGQEIVVDKEEMVQKTDGWYTVDDMGTEDTADDVETLAIPIFTFTYSKDALFAPTVEAPVALGIIGVEYTAGKVETDNAARTEVALYYNPTAGLTNVTVADLKGNKNGWVLATADHATFGKLTSGSLRFTPKVTGSFAYYLKAVASEIEVAEAIREDCSKPISVTTAVQEQKLVNIKFRNFVKTNWLSLVFLGIAFLCIVGIVVLAFYKPKDAEEIKAKKDAKKERVEDVEAEKAEDVEEVDETVDEAEEAEEAEEAPVEEAEEVEAPAEEATAEEAPVEVAPVEETTEAPAEEKPEGENA